MMIAQLLYGPLSPLYDLICGSMLQPGRRRALSILDPRPGERILEVGVGSGYNINGYPPGCLVLAVDLSASMITRARDRVDDVHHRSVSFAQMDGQCLAAANGTFDAVFVPHTINVLQDPFIAGHEIARVCKPDGRIVFLNHFADLRHTSPFTNHVAGRLAAAADVNWHLPLRVLAASARLRVVRVEPVNVPALSSVVLCERIASPE